MIRNEPTIAGTWRLTGARVEDASGRALEPPYGPSPTGLLHFDDLGRMVCAIADGRTGEFADRAYLSYAGEYSFDGETISTRVDCCSDPAWLGSVQRRHATLDGNRLTLSHTPEVDRSSGAIRIFAWERLVRS